MKRFLTICLLLLSACDLQPKIVALPDTVGEFISSRYPALLADPEVQPEIYDSAATDYGVYASPELYGTGANADDYILYASANDYTLTPPPQVQIIESNGENLITHVPNEYLNVPEYGTIIKQRGQEVVIATPTPIVTAPVLVTPIKAAVATITVGAGDTLYSISRKYATPVNDLAVMNRLSSPFTLSVGQKLKVPKITDVQMPDKKIVPVKTALPAAKPAPAKISSAPVAKLPKITTRSSSKFSWPVKGTTLSAYGAKSNGLFNDGINIAAARGTSVKAAENGVVAYAGNELKGMGNLVIVQHSGGWMTVYAHMDSLAVRRGVKVNVGQKIGTVGQTGKVERPQLHFEIRKGTKAYDPKSYLK